MLPITECLPRGQSASRVKKPPIAKSPPMSKYYRVNKITFDCTPFEKLADDMPSDISAYPCMQNTEETIAKYAVDANLFRFGSTDPKKNPAPGCFLVGASPPVKRHPTVGFFYFLGLVDPSRNRLASKAYSSIISSIILVGFLSGFFNRLPV